MAEFVSILMLTYNAPHYVELTIRSLVEKTQGVDYELIVVDNASGDETRNLVSRLTKEGLITRLTLLDYNSLFARGNNIAAGMASDQSTHFLLLNSDIEIKSANWLRHLLDIHKRGITSYGWVSARPRRVDGYCLLIDTDLYLRHKLDEAHAWWWSITKLQALLLNEGFRVQGYGNHERYIHHFGGGSGNGFVGAKGMDVTADQADSWFKGRYPVCLDEGWRGLMLRSRSLLRRLSGNAGS